MHNPKKSLLDDYYVEDNPTGKPHIAYKPLETLKTLCGRDFDESKVRWKSFPKLTGNECQRCATKITSTKGLFDSLPVFK